MTDLPKPDLTCVHYEKCKPDDLKVCHRCEFRFVILKHAAAHHKKYSEVVRLPEKYNKPTPDFYVANLNYEKGRRDAVLKLAGLRVEGDK